MIKWMMLLSLTLTVFAHAKQDLGKKVAHGNFEDEKKCLKEIRALNCGIPEDHKTFIACVDNRIEELSPSCQTFHAEEVERLKNQ